IDEYYSDVRYERIAILNALGAYYSYLGKIETKQREKEEHFILATQYYNKASRIDMHEPSTWVGKGQLLLAKGDVEQAFAAFKIVLDGDRDNVPALLGQACVEFNRGRYSESLELYKLDPENAEALVALAITDLHKNEAAGIRKGMEKMQRAFEIYPYCAMALNYLANHFFFTGQHFLVEQLTETALAVTNHGQTKAHSYYNLARSYHSKGDYEKAGLYYMASVKEINKPYEFIFPYYGLGQVQLKLGDLRSAQSNFEKVLEVYPDNCETMKALGHIYVQLGQTEKAQEFMRKATKIDPRDSQAFLELGELLISSDTGAALDSFKTARGLLKKGGQEVPIELLNNIGVLHFERGEFELAEQSFKEALGDGIWLAFLEGREKSQEIDASASILQYKDMQLFHRLEDGGRHVELPWNKVTPLFNLARLQEQLNNAEIASILYRLILFKYPDYVDAYLRLAAIAKVRNNVQLSIELVHDALKVNDKCPNALSMLGELELKNDDWVKAKETFRAASDATDGKDSYATLSLGNWNYFAAIRNEKRNPKLEATHLEKAKELYTRVLLQHPANLYAANGAGVVLAEKGHFDVSKDIFTQVQEAASGNIFVQMPDVWINLAHVYFAQGNFSLAVKMYQNCLRKFYYNTDSQILLYLARTYYEAEQWQDCKKTLLRAIHLAPSNYTLRFDAGVTLQKFSASTLQKTKKTADEVRSTIAELENAVRLFSQLSAASNLHFHGFDEKKIDTHVDYCKNVLAAAKPHLEAAIREEQQIRQRQEVARQVALAEEARRKAEEQRKFQLEKRKQEDELKRVRQQEEHFQRIKSSLFQLLPDVCVCWCMPIQDQYKMVLDLACTTNGFVHHKWLGHDHANAKWAVRHRTPNSRSESEEQWKSSTPASKRRERTEMDDEEGGNSEKRRRKGGKRRKKDKSSKSRYETLEAEADMMDDQEDLEDEDANLNYREPGQNDQDDAEENAHAPLAAAGLEDSDAEDDVAAPSSTTGRRRRAWSESDDDEPLERQPLSREHSPEPRYSDEEVKEDGHRPNGNAAAEDED
ncbi:protein CTR9 homolog, partial [Fagus crenata]